LRVAGTLLNLLFVGVCCESIKKRGRKYCFFDSKWYCFVAMERQLRSAELLERRRKIGEELKRRNGLSEWDFLQVHVGCRVEVVKTGPRRVDGRYDGWRRVVPMVKYKCLAHGAESAEIEGKPCREDLS